MRQYDDPVEVRRGEAEDPEQFLWRGRLWKVRAVVAHWVETGPWRQPAPPGHAVAGVGTARSAARELWRVEAGRGMPSGVRLVDGAEPAGHGVFDLSFDGTDGRWQLVGCQD
ncbi:hypothetical protein KDN32_07535 [Nocardioides sp. J2M5]|uniref:DUF6504 family protein n=1 Tax=Nocardioides palaemonis TaxID=2829810 RepID=UPI001BA722AD|nr:DUF6504 family protein [Nocardioides palaemonis]MBS2937590.1 hypothetical protein [Nocardioides palaemonis]